MIHLTYHNNTDSMYKLELRRKEGNYMSDCVFCKIIANEIPSRKVYEDDSVVAFLDLTQTTAGHTLVVPKKHVPDIFEYNAELAKEVFSRVPKIAKAIKSSNSAIKGMNILMNNGAVAYQSVNHSHIHLIPRYSEEDTFSIQFTDNSEKWRSEELDQLAESIKHELEETK